jgi:uncharacterized phage protein (TIGR01671 family)
MKIIKFRAWNGGNREWLSPSDIKILCDGSMEVLGNKALSLDLFHDYYPLITVESFTNLLDNNINEVYEGDYLRVYNPNYQIQQFDIIYKVIWRCVQFELAVVKVNKWEKFNVSAPEVGDVAYSINILQSRIFEVIGNIHETTIPKLESNPERA